MSQSLLGSLISLSYCCSWFSLIVFRYRFAKRLQERPKIHFSWILFSEINSYWWLSEWLVNTLQTAHFFFGLLHVTLLPPCGFGPRQCPIIHYLCTLKYCLHWSLTILISAAVEPFPALLYTFYLIVHFTIHANWNSAQCPVGCSPLIKRSEAKITRSDSSLLIVACAVPLLSGVWVRWKKKKHQLGKMTDRERETQFNNLSKMQFSNMPLLRLSYSSRRFLMSMGSLGFASQGGKGISIRSPLVSSGASPR